MKCLQCNKNNPQNALFCGGCGTPLRVSVVPDSTGSFPELPMVDFVTSVKRSFSNYAIFKDRSTRAEFWWWFLFAAIGATIFGILGAATRLPLEPIFSLATLIPGVALGARRLHDINKSGWWQLLWIGFLLIIPIVVILVWATKRGDVGPNKHGQDPRQAST